jgi:hypothetical protein
MLILLKISISEPSAEEKMQIDKVIAYLKENSHPYMTGVSQGASVSFVSEGNILTEIYDEQGIENFIGFLAKVGVEKHKICFIEQIAFIRGDGKQLYDYFPLFGMSLNEFEAAFHR